MNIHWDSDTRCFHLQTPEMSYAFCVTADGRLVHLYWGGAMRDASLCAMAAEPRKEYNPAGGVNQWGLPEYEVPTMEPGDFSDPLLVAVQPDGVRSLRLQYRSHEVRGEELVVTLRDRVYPFEVEAHYKGWGELPLVSRWLVLRNAGEEPIRLNRLQSAAWHVPAGEWRLTHLSGSWGCEYTRNEVMLTQARTVLQNNRITCGAAQQTPFFALDAGGRATETMGELFFGVLHWSGNFSITAEKQFGQEIAVSGGINDFDCEYVLRPGEALQTEVFYEAGLVRGE